MKKTILSSLVILACAPALAFADGDSFGPFHSGYVGTQYGEVTYKEDAVPGKFKLSGLVVRIGFDINQYLAVEGRVGGSVKSDSNANMNLDIDHMYGVYAVGTLHLNPQFEVYGAVGNTRGQASATGGGVSVTSSDTGLSYGAGIGWNIDDGATLSIEYMSYMKKSNFDAKAITIGLSDSF